jgi:hypothetical protein
MAIIADIPFSYTANVVPVGCTNPRNVCIRSSVPVRIEECSADDAPISISTLSIKDSRHPAEGAVSVATRIGDVDVWQRRIMGVAPSAANTERISYRRAPNGGLVVPGSWRKHPFNQNIELTREGFQGQVDVLGNTKAYKHSPFLKFEPSTEMWIAEGARVRRGLGDNRVVHAAAVSRLFRNAVFVDGLLHLPSPGPGWQVFQGHRVCLIRLVREFAPGHDMFRIDRLEEAVRNASHTYQERMRIQEPGDQGGICITGEVEILDYAMVDGMEDGDWSALCLAVGNLLKVSAEHVGRWNRPTVESWLDMRDEHARRPEPDNPEFLRVVSRFTASVGAAMSHLPGGEAVVRALHRIAVHPQVMLDPQGEPEPAGMRLD